MTKQLTLLGEFQLQKYLSKTRRKAQIYTIKTCRKVMAFSVSCSLTFSSARRN